MKTISENEFNLGDPVFHCDLPEIPILIISTAIVNDVVHFIVEKIGAPQHPCKLNLTTKVAYKNYWGKSEIDMVNIRKRLNKINYGTEEF